MLKVYYCKYFQTCTRHRIFRNQEMGKVVGIFRKPCYSLNYSL